jgi:3-hydroxy-3-methylglutaryl CoA synthase
VISGDGKGVPMRKPSTRARIVTHDSKRGPKPDRKKMAIVGSAYDAQTYKRSVYQVWQALFDEIPAAANDEDFQPRPKPIAKVVRAALSEIDEHGKSINPRETIFHWFGEQVRQRDPLEQKKVIVLMDGQP